MGDAMVFEVCRRLEGKGASPSQPVWAEAARYLSGRIQGAAAEMPGRNPDMSPAAAAALRAVLESMEGKLSPQGRASSSSGGATPGNSVHRLAGTERAELVDQLFFRPAWPPFFSCLALGGT